MRKALKRSFEKTYGKPPANNTGTYILDEAQIDNYKVHGIADVVLHFNPIASKISFGKSNEFWYDAIIDIAPLNKVTAEMLPKGIWFKKSTDSVSEECDLVLNISGKQELPKNALFFDLCRSVEGIYLLPYYRLNKVEFDLSILYGELQE